MSEQITKEELDAWAARYAAREDAIYQPTDWRVIIPRLIAEVRRLREVNGFTQESNKILRGDREHARTKIEEQAKEIERLKEPKGAVPGPGNGRNGDTLLPWHLRNRG